MAAEKTSNFYWRVDSRVKERLQLLAFEQRMTVTKFLTDLVKRELGFVEVEPEPDPGVASRGVQEVPPDDSGKPLPVQAEEVSATTGEREQFCLSSSVPEVEKQERKSPSKRLPEGFRDIPELLKVASQYGVLDPEWQLEQFCDYHIARGSQFVSWLAAWRTWIRNTVRSQERQSGGGYGGKVSSLLAEKQRVAGQIFGSRGSADIQGVSRRVPPT